jgi:ABC-type nitrate/sulfonate/bicarbonate transport system substrate-binding protein
LTVSEKSNRIACRLREVGGVKVIRKYDCSFALRARRYGAAVVFAVLLSAFVAAGEATATRPAGGQAARLAELDTVRVATPRTVITSVFWGLQSFAKKRNLKIEYVPAQTFADMQRGVASGQVDVTGLGYNNPAIMADQGITNVKIVAGWASGSQNLIARKGSGINTWSDLEGKSVGIIPGSYAAIMFIVAAREHRVDLDKVRLVNLNPIAASLVTALDRGQIDALVWVAPVMQQAISQDVAYAPSGINIADNGGLGGSPTGILAVNSDFMAKTSVFNRFLATYVETLRWYQRHRDKWARFVAFLTGVDPAIAKSSVGGGKLQGGLTLVVSRAGLLGAARQGPVFGYTRQDQSSKVLAYVDVEPLAKLLKVNASSLLK